jgi:glycerol uptake facilitator-like aquaporin
MAERLLDCSLVLFALTLIYLLPTFPAARRWLPGRSTWDVVLSAAALGMASQAVIGFLWEHLGGRNPGLESLLYLGGWAALSLTTLIGKKDEAQGKAGTSPGRWLAAILVAGVALRLVYPLTNVALGQSDAYSHLQFLQDIIARGHLRNPAYPSGYHWVLTLPCLWLRVDPYLVARYGGAFFGGLLIVAVGLFPGNRTGRKAGLTAALLVAVFPGFMPLIKTGVGAFANQMGLLFLLLTLREYLSCVTMKERADRNHILLIGVYLAGLAVSVPLMTIQAVAFIALERFVALLRERRLWTARTLPLLLPLLPAALLITLHSVALPEKVQQRSAKMITARHTSKTPKNKEEGEKTSKGKRPHLLLATDLFSVKRWGLGSPSLNAGAAILLTAFALLILVGIRSGRAFHIGVGIWGLFTLVQTVTGFLEFSAYQRAGWTLMLAAAILGGLIYNEIEQYAGERLPFAQLSVLGALAVTVWAFFTPPRHAHIMSSAEPEMVRLARTLAQDDRFSRARWASFETLKEPAVTGLLDPDLPLTLLTRNFSTMKGRQGNIVSAVLDFATGIHVLQISKTNPVDKAIDSGSQILFLVDRPKKLSPRQLGIAGRVDPGMGRIFSRWQYGLYRGNDDLEAMLDRLEGEGWQTRQVNVGPNLEVTAAAPP